MTTIPTDPAIAAGLRRIRANPGTFFRDWLGIDPWEKQVAIAESVRDHRRTAVKSCHASGKSYITARVVVWYLHAYPSSVVITTAPTGNQVRNILWREINSAYSRAPKPLLGRCLTMQVNIAPDWYALGFKASDTDADRFQGFHSERALVVIDEAAGVAESVFEALDAALTSEQARLLLIGNPTSASGTFYDAFHSARDLYHCITIAAHDTPNLQAGVTIRPYLITQQWIDDAVTRYGAESPYVQSRVHAEFPTLGDDTLIPLAWAEAANVREVATTGGELEGGLDVARLGSDSNALCIRRGPAVLAEYRWSGLDTMQTVGKVRAILTEWLGLVALKVDVIGVGAGVADRLREAGYPVVDVNVASAASDPERFANLRHELWWNLRERFREGQIAGPFDETTLGQLTSIKYKYDSRHTAPLIESKDDMRKRGLRSPDQAEAVLLAFSQPPDPAAAFWNALAARSDTCPACGRASLVRHRDGTWRCGSCGTTRLAASSP